MSKWNDIPIGRENAVTYDDLCAKWGKNKRAVRRILQEISREDNGDGYVLIRTAHGHGFYRTDDEYEIASYRKEILNRGRNVLAALKKVNRVLKHSDGQMEIFNNIKCLRETLGMRQKDVCEAMWSKGIPIDCGLLSKFENGVCLPLPDHVSAMAEIFAVERDEVFMVQIPMQTVKHSKSPLASGDRA